MTQTIDVGHVIDQRRPGWFGVQLVAIAFFLVLADGYDIAAIGFAAPGMIHQFGITDMSVLGPVFGASLVGILVGAPVFGAVGDRWGRKVATISACIGFGIFTWMTSYAQGVGAVIALRFMAGIGIGGVLPNLTALVIEWAPMRYRATMMICVFTGVAFGGAFPGLVAATLVPAHGWPIIFQIGGAFPVVVGLAAIWLLPESAKFLVVSGQGGAAVARAMGRLQGGVVAEGARFTLGETKHSGMALPRLFADGLAPLTALLWLVFVLNLMGYFFLLSWTPTVLAAAHIDPSKAAVAGVLTQIGGVIGSLILARPMDRMGLGPIAALEAFAVPVVAVIGYAAAAEAQTLLFVLQFLAGFGVLAAQTGLNAVSGLIYPTSVRSNGSGWAFGVGRVGSIVGPVVGGYLIAAHLPIQQLYLVACLPFAVAAVAALVMARLYKRHFGGRAIDQRAHLEGGIAH